MSSATLSPITDNDLMSPTGSQAAQDFALAARVPSLEGLTVGMLNNQKRNADVFLGFVAEILRAQHGVKDVVIRKKAEMSKPAPADVMHELAEKSDVLVTGLGDCGSCSASSVIDAMNAERINLPAVAVVTTAFQVGGEAVAGMQGGAGYEFAIVQHPLGALEPDELRARAELAVPQIVALLTGSKA